MPTALLSVSNKKGLVELASDLTKLGWRLLASLAAASTLAAPTWSQTVPDAVALATGALVLAALGARRRWGAH